jgi:GntR family transcriptional regulator
MHGSAFVISQADPTPMYQQLIDQICQHIAAGDWPAGHELPSIRALAASVRVSVITVKRAYLELERERVIVTRPGKGSVVAAGAELALRLKREELEEHLKAVAGLSVLLGLSVHDITRRLQELRARVAEEGSVGAAAEGGPTGAGDDEPGDEGRPRRLGEKR